MNMSKTLRIFLSAVLFVMILSLYAGAASPFLESEDGLLYSENDGNITVEGYKVTQPSLKIPAEIDGKPVTAIAPYAFCNDDSITAVAIPDSVTEIGDHAFAECKSLISAEIPASVTVLPDSSFFNCSVLSSVSLADGIKKIGTSAFEGCRMLSSLKIPASVEEIGPDAFAGCEHLLLDCGNNRIAKDYALANHLRSSFFDSPIFLILLTAVCVVLIFVAGKAVKMVVQAKRGKKEN